MDYNKVFEFFKEQYKIDLSDTEYYIFELVGRNGFYNPIEDVVFVDCHINMINRELTFVHELTHRMIHINSIETNDEEEYCKQVVLEYVKYEFNEEAVTLLKDII